MVRRQTLCMAAKIGASFVGSEVEKYRFQVQQRSEAKRLEELQIYYDSAA
jgi:hypothetical protein